MRATSETAGKGRWKTAAADRPRIPRLLLFLNVRQSPTNCSAAANYNPCARENATAPAGIESIPTEAVQSASLSAVGRAAYSTWSTMLSEWLLNSGAYMHWMAAKPV